MCDVCGTLLSMLDKRRNCALTIQLSIKRNATSRLRSHNGWRCGCKPQLCSTIGWIFVVARQISARSSQWKSPRNFRSHDGYRNAACSRVLRKQQIELNAERSCLILGLGLRFLRRSLYELEH